MKKELRPIHDAVNCAVCGRTILKGERTESFLAPGGHRHDVCQLCFDRAEHIGWIREAAAGDAPARMPRAEPRRSLLGRLRRQRPDDRSDLEPAAVPEKDVDTALRNGGDPGVRERRRPSARACCRRTLGTCGGCRPRRR